MIFLLLQKNTTCEKSDFSFHGKQSDDKKVFLFKKVLTVDNLMDSITVGVKVRLTVDNIIDSISAPVITCPGV